MDQEIFPSQVFGTMSNDRKVLDTSSRDNNPREGVETTLQRAEMQLAWAMEMAALAYWEFDIATATYTFNDRFYALLSTSAEREGGYEMAAEVYARRFLPLEDQHFVLDTTARLLAASEQEPQVEHRIIRRDGEVRHVAVRCGLVKDAAGRTIGHRGVNQDITERKREHERLLRSERMLQAVAGSMPALIGQCNRDLVCTFAYFAQDEWLGRSADKVIGMRLQDLIGDEQFRAVEAKIREVLAGGSHGYESKWENRDGTTKDCWVELVPDLAPDGTAEGFFIFIADISELKRKEDALRQSEERFRSVVAAMVEGVLVQRNDGMIIDCNKQAAHILGTTPDLVMGKTSRDLRLNPLQENGSRLAPEEEPAMVAVRTGERMLNVVAGIHRPDGSLRWINMNAEPMLRPGESRPYAAVTTITDITERKQAEESLRQSEERFLRAQKMEAVGLLAGGVAHDFNNIMAAVMLHLGLLEEEPSLDPATKSSLKELQKNVQRGAALTRQLLAFSRQQAMEPKVLDLRRLLQGLSKMLRRLLGENIELSFTGPERLPLTRGDPGMLEQAVMNLCVNARDAMPNGGRLILHLDAVEVGAEAAAANPDARAGCFLRLRVTDNGCGMDAPTLRRIFEPYFTTKEVGKGTGLGLATVYGIVKQHQGWVEVQSAVGSGTTFRIHLPTCAAAAEDADAGGDPRMTSGGNEAVLLVEDEGNVRAAAITALRRHGYRVFGAASGPEALRSWEKCRGQIDLLLTDVVMPGGMNGRELAARLRRQKPDLKIIICSGYSQDPNAPVSDPVEPATILRKPFNIAQLLQAVQKCLNGG
jgi:two-component system, cell cycle sensor histidine kinase and response regulator CckA